MNATMTEEQLDRYLDAALWWENMKATNNDTFLPLLFDEHRFLVLKGGGGSGKSIFAGRKILERVTTEHSPAAIAERHYISECTLRRALRRYYEIAGRKLPGGGD